MPDATNLEKLKIYAPSLRILKVDGNINLKEIYVIPFLVDLINIDNCPLLTKTLLTGKAFGKKEWEKYFGDIRVEPPLPANIEEILNEPCSFWPTRKVKETHLLVLIPNTLNGKLFTMNYLKEFVQKPKFGYATKYKYYSDHVKEVVGDKSYPSHWVLMTRDVIPGSRYKKYSECCYMVASHSKKTALPYELPHELDVTASILMHYVKTGERLYSDSQWTWTYSQDVDKVGDSLIIGGFSSDGIYISRSSYSSDGVAGCRVLN